jgi:hypothetical protein
MADEQDSVLRNSLDAVDRGRRWAMLGFGALFVATILALGAVFWTASRLAAPPSAFWGALNIMWAAHSHDQGYHPADRPVPTRLAKARTDCCPLVR